MRSSALHSSLRGAIERRHVDPRFLCRPSQPYAPSLQLLRHGNYEAVICDWSHLVRSNAVRSNAMSRIERTRSWHKLEIKRNVYDWTYAGLRSIALRTIECTLDLAAHLILSINRTVLFSFHFYVLKAPWRPKTSLLITVIPLNRHLFYNAFICFILVSYFFYYGFVYIYLCLVHIFYH